LFQWQGPIQNFCPFPFEQILQKGALLVSPALGPFLKSARVLNDLLFDWFVDFHSF